MADCDAKDGHTRGYLRAKNPLAGGLLLELHDSCPGSYMNDCRGTKQEVNVIWDEEGEMLDPALNMSDVSFDSFDRARTY